MKIIKIYLRPIIMVLIASLTLSSCMVHHHPYDDAPRGYYKKHKKAHKRKGIPPGHQKKMYHHKSAKPFAPGHNK